MIEYKHLTPVSLAAVKQLYQQHGWLAYLQDDEKLERAFERSLYILGAYDGGELVGLIRCVGDGEHIVLIQDLIVAQTHLRQGIGRELMHRAGEHFRRVRTLMLLTDAQDERANAFYEAIGMRKTEAYGCTAYMR